LGQFKAGGEYFHAKFAMKTRRMLRISLSRKVRNEDAKHAENLCGLCVINFYAICVILARMSENEISHKIIGCALEIHKTLGPGLLESVYESALVYDLREIGLVVDRQLPVPLIYKEVKHGEAFKLDLLVENKVIIEIKSVENLAPVHFAQTLTYLRLADKRLGLLINFNTKLLKEGIHRMVNNL